MQVKRIILSCAAVLLAVFCFCSCSRNRDKSAKKTGDKFIVGFECGFRPHGYLDNETGEYAGFDLDLAREICKRRGWKIVMKPIEWSTKELLLKHGEIDCICNGFTMETREDLYEWSSPYIYNYQTVVVKKGTKVRTFKDLVGKVVAVEASSPVEHEFLYGEFSKVRQVFSRLKPFEDFHDMMKALCEDGELDAVVVDSLAALTWIKDFDAPLEITDLTLCKSHDGIAFKKGNRALRNQVEETLQEIFEDGTYDKLLKQWFGYTNISPYRRHN